MTRKQNMLLFQELSPIDAQKEVFAECCALRIMSFVSGSSEAVASARLLVDPVLSETVISKKRF